MQLLQFYDFQLLDVLTVYDELDKCAHLLPPLTACSAWVYMQAANNVIIHNL